MASLPPCPCLVLDALEEDFTAEEIEVAIASLPPGKSTGPNVATQLNSIKP